jgi:PAS domain S-box-containing protein
VRLPETVRASGAAAVSTLGFHSPLLIALSILIAMAASFTALDLAGRIRYADGWGRRAWLGAAALVLGGGIWSMHFVGMLAFSAAMPATYDFQLTLLSFLIALVVTGFGFYVASRDRVTLLLIGLSGIIMGLGIAGMHYTGMAAMHVGARLSYDPLYVVLSIMIAIGASTAALWLAFRTHSLGQKLAAAVAMGVAISGMHYVAIFGTDFQMHPADHVTVEPALVGNVQLVVAVTAATFVILCAAAMAAIYDRRFASLADREAVVLRESEERFRFLYRKTPLPLHSLGPDGRIEQVSDRWLALLGYEREDVIGHPITDFMTPDSTRQRNEEHWPRLLASGELREAEYRMVAKDGRVFDCILSAIAERDDEGKVTRTLCGLIDVTERRRAEEALRQAQKLEAVGQLTGGIAHDFNNLLAVILGNLELARKRAPDDARLLRLLDNTIQGAQRGAALTQRMLAFARRQDLKPEPVDVPDLVLGMADLLRRSIGPSVRIETRFPLGLARARVDANQLELALLNLAVNSRDAMPNGGSIVIAAREEEVANDASEGSDGSGLANGHYFCLAVSDDGPGMDRATLARATEPFFTTKGVGKGTGLGLAMVHGLAAQSGGRLVLKSQVGEGTTAEIWLPIAGARPEVAPPVAVAEPPPVPQGVSAVLVVDDDLLVLTSTAAMLEDLGYATAEASTGMQALEMLESGRTFDVVLTDQAMPGMTGVQLAAAIKARWPNLPVVLGTGYAELPEGADPDLLRLGKPFSRDSLERAVTSAARSRRGNVVTLQPRHA